MTNPPTPTERQQLANGDREKLTEAYHLMLTHSEAEWLREIKRAGKFRSMSAAARSILRMVKEEDEAGEFDRAFTSD
jgi:hypothetical protein